MTDLSLIANIVIALSVYEFVKTVAEYLYEKIKKKEKKK